MIDRLLISCFTALIALIIASQIFVVFYGPHIYEWQLKILAPILVAAFGIPFYLTRDR